MTLNSAARLLELVGPCCRDQERRSLLRQSPAAADVNGIDFVQYEQIPPAAGAPPGTAPRHLLRVHLLRDDPLPTDSAAWLQVHGGTRITGIRVLGVAVAGPGVLDVDVDAQGDFSPYVLSFGWKRDAAGDWHHELAQMDRLFSVAPVNFRPGCPVDFDCAPPEPGPPAQSPEPQLDYLAKDYASFRQMLLDLIAQRNPRWTERSPADLGNALLELFAYEGDQLSYFQDSVANEAYLDTAHQRVSVKRHARLVDYEMHDGRNAWTYAQFTVSASGAGTLPAGTQLLTRITAPLRSAPRTTPPRDRGQPNVEPPPLLDPRDLDFGTDPALLGVRVFETATAVRLDPLHNELRLHTWGNEQCTLAPGATTAHLYAVGTGGKALCPGLVAGNLLLLEEVKASRLHPGEGPDPGHRAVVRIQRVSSARDPLFSATLNEVTGEPRPRTGPEPELELLEVTWSAAEAPDFPLCLSEVLDDRRTTVRAMTVARGNVVAADHGRTVWQTYEFASPVDGSRPLRLSLAEAPLTFQCEPGTPAQSFPPLRDRPGLHCAVRDARPAVALRTWRDGVTTDWLPVPDLLSSGEFAHHFVADVDGEGRAVLRFGDGQYGAVPVGVDRAEAWYRVGNGLSGGIGSDALYHLVVPHWKDRLLKAPHDWPAVTQVRNPLPARSGTDAETIEQVRQYAPAAFRTGQLRAVTEDDYRIAAQSIDGVSGAVAAFRWTGSWYTVCVGIDPEDPRQVLTDARGGTRFAPHFRRHVHDALSGFRLAGYDLEIRPARYVPLDVALHLCAQPGYFRGDVAHAVAQALCGGAGPDGAPGLFDPAHLTFGQPVHLSRIYATAAAVPGVESVIVTEFKRHGRSPDGELESGILPIGSWEIARLENDPSAMENGTLTLTSGGGS
ncbi:hypothetical protein ACFVZL_36270 [Streptomyces sp. NPDC058320]|uniref:hypothetical protein n=1 Tax=unclassified Streptomyces TaxID=2593676 RepID=UPI003639E0E2